MTNAKHWQQSYSGKIVMPRDLQPDQVQLADIPHALAQKVRFNGQLSVPGYCVAQHTIIGAEEFASRGLQDLALAFLLHEVDEVYLPDVPSPIKGALRVVLDDGSAISWSELCQRHARAIFEHLGLLPVLPLIYSAEVHDMDLRLLVTEKRDLMGPEPQPWGFTAKPLESRIERVWDYKTSKSIWTALYEQLRAEFDL